MGSIDKVPGGYRARWRSPEGASRSKNFQRKVDAERFLLTVEASKLTTGYIDPAAGRLTIADYAEQWRAAQVHRPLTEVRVESALRNHILPSFGHRQIGAVRPTEVQAWVRQLAQVQKASTLTVNFRLFATIYRAAVRDRLIAFSPCEGVKLPSVERHRVQPLGTDQVEALATAIGDVYQPLIHLAAGAGLRLGEALGTEVRHVDFLRRQLSVEQQAVTVRGTTSLAAVKTSASRRVVPLGATTLRQLAAWLESHPRAPGDLLVTDSRSGGPLPRNRFGEVWQQAVKGAGLAKGVRFHDLRHTYASALIAGGCSVKVVQSRLGHTSASVTLDVYSHLWPDDDDRSRDAIDRFLTAGGPFVADTSVTQG